MFRNNSTGATKRPNKRYAKGTGKDSPGTPEAKGVKRTGSLLQFDAHKNKRSVRRVASASYARTSLDGASETGGYRNASDTGEAKGGAKGMATLHVSGATRQHSGRPLGYQDSGGYGFRRKRASVAELSDDDSIYSSCASLPRDEDATLDEQATLEGGNATPEGDAKEDIATKDNKAQHAVVGSEIGSKEMPVRTEQHANDVQDVPVHTETAINTPAIDETVRNSASSEHDTRPEQKRVVDIGQVTVEGAGKSDAISGSGDLHKYKDGTPANAPSSKANTGSSLSNVNDGLPGDGLPCMSNDLNKDASIASSTIAKGNRGKRSANDVVVQVTVRTPPSEKRQRLVKEDINRQWQQDKELRREQSSDLSDLDCGVIDVTSPSEKQRFTEEDINRQRQQDKELRRKQLSPLVIGAGATDIVSDSPAQKRHDMMGERMNNIRMSQGGKNSWDDLVHGSKNSLDNLTVEQHRDATVGASGEDRDMETLSERTEILAEEIWLIATKLMTTEVEALSEHIRQLSVHQKASACGTKSENLVLNGLSQLGGMIYQLKMSGQQADSAESVSSGENLFATLHKNLGGSCPEKSSSGLFRSFKKSGRRKTQPTWLYDLQQKICERLPDHDVNKLREHLQKLKLCESDIVLFLHVATSYWNKIDALKDANHSGGPQEDIAVRAAMKGRFYGEMMAVSLMRMVEPSQSLSHEVENIDQSALFKFLNDAVQSVTSTHSNNENRQLKVTMRAVNENLNKNNAERIEFFDDHDHAGTKDVMSSALPVALPASDDAHDIGTASGFAASASHGQIQKHDPANDHKHEIFPPAASQLGEDLLSPANVEPVEGALSSALVWKSLPAQRNNARCSIEGILLQEKMRKSGEKFQKTLDGGDVVEIGDTLTDIIQPIKEDIVELCAMIRVINEWHKLYQEAGCTASESNARKHNMARIIHEIGKIMVFFIAQQDAIDYDGVLKQDMRIGRHLLGVMLHAIGQEYATKEQESGNVGLWQRAGSRIGSRKNAWTVALRKALREKSKNADKTSEVIEKLGVDETYITELIKISKGSAAGAIWPEVCTNASMKANVNNNKRKKNINRDAFIVSMLLTKLMEMVGTGEDVSAGKLEKFLVHSVYDAVMSSSVVSLERRECCRELADSLGQIAVSAADLGNLLHAYDKHESSAQIKDRHIAKGHTYTDARGKTVSDGSMRDMIKVFSVRLAKLDDVMPGVSYSELVLHQMETKRKTGLRQLRLDDILPNVGDSKPVLRQMETERKTELNLLMVIQDMYKCIEDNDMDQYARYINSLDSLCSPKICEALFREYAQKILDAQKMPADQSPQEDMRGMFQRDLTAAIVLARVSRSCTGCDDSWTIHEVDLMQLVGAAAVDYTRDTRASEAFIATHPDATARNYKDIMSDLMTNVECLLQEIEQHFGQLGEQYPIHHADFIVAEKEPVNVRDIGVSGNIKRKPVHEKKHVQSITDPKDVAAKDVTGRKNIEENAVLSKSELLQMKKAKATMFGALRKCKGLAISEKAGSAEKVAQNMQLLTAGIGAWMQGQKQLNELDIFGQMIFTNALESLQQSEKIFEGEEIFPYTSMQQIVIDLEDHMKQFVYGIAQELGITDTHKMQIELNKRDRDVQNILDLAFDNMLDVNVMDCLKAQLKSVYADRDIQIKQKRQIMTTYITAACLISWQGLHLEDKENTAIFNYLAKTIKVPIAKISDTFQCLEDICLAENVALPTQAEAEAIDVPKHAEAAKNVAVPAHIKTADTGDMELYYDTPWDGGRAWAAGAEMRKAGSEDNMNVSHIATLQEYVKAISVDDVLQIKNAKYTSCVEGFQACKLYCKNMSTGNKATGLIATEWSVRALAGEIQRWSDDQAKNNHKLSTQVQIEHILIEGIRKSLQNHASAESNVDVDIYKNISVRKICGDILHSTEGLDLYECNDIVQQALGNAIDPGIRAYFGNKLYHRKFARQDKDAACNELVSDVIAALLISGQGVYLDKKATVGVLERVVQADGSVVSVAAIGNIRTKLDAVRVNTMDVVKLQEAGEKGLEALFNQGRFEKDTQRDLLHLLSIIQEDFEWQTSNVSASAQSAQPSQRFLGLHHSNIRPGTILYNLLELFYGKKLVEKLSDKALLYSQDQLNDCLQQVQSLLHLNAAEANKFEKHMSRMQAKVNILSYSSASDQALPMLAMSCLLFAAYSDHGRNMMCQLYNANSANLMQGEGLESFKKLIEDICRRFSVEPVYSELAFKAQEGHLVIADPDQVNTRSSAQEDPLVEYTEPVFKAREGHLVIADLDQVNTRSVPVEHRSVQAGDDHVLSDASDRAKQAYDMSYVMDVSEDVSDERRDPYSMQNDIMVFHAEIVPTHINQAGAAKVHAACAVLKSRSLDVLESDRVYVYGRINAEDAVSLRYVKHLAGIIGSNLAIQKEHVTSIGDASQALDARHFDVTSLPVAQDSSMGVGDGLLAEHAVSPGTHIGDNIALGISDHHPVDIQIDPKNNFYFLKSLSEQGTPLGIIGDFLRFVSKQDEAKVISAVKDGTWQNLDATISNDFYALVESMYADTTRPEQVAEKIRIILARVVIGSMAKYTELSGQEILDMSVIELMKVEVSYRLLMEFSTNEQLAMVVTREKDLLKQNNIDAKMIASMSHMQEDLQKKSCIELMQKWFSEEEVASDGTKRLKFHICRDAVQANDVRTRLPNRISESDTPVRSMRKSMPIEQAENVLQMHARQIGRRHIDKGVSMLNARYENYLYIARGYVSNLQEEWQECEALGGDDWADVNQSDIGAASMIDGMSMIAAGRLSSMVYHFLRDKDKAITIYEKQFKANRVTSVTIDGKTVNLSYSSAMLMHNALIQVAEENGLDIIAPCQQQQKHMKRNEMYHRFLKILQAKDSDSDYKVNEQNMQDVFLQQLEADGKLVDNIATAYERVFEKLRKSVAGNVLTRRSSQNIARYLQVLLACREKVERAVYGNTDAGAMGKMRAQELPDCHPLLNLIDKRIYECIKDTPDKRIYECIKDTPSRSSLWTLLTHPHAKVLNMGKRIWLHRDMAPPVRLHAGITKSLQMWLEKHDQYSLSILEIEKLVHSHFILPTIKVNNTYGCLAHDIELYGGGNAVRADNVADTVVRDDDTVQVNMWRQRRYDAQNSASDQPDKSMLRTASQHRGRVGGVIIDMEGQELRSAKSETDQNKDAVFVESFKNELRYNGAPYSNDRKDRKNDNRVDSFDQFTHDSSIAAVASDAKKEFVPLREESVWDQKNEYDLGGRDAQLMQTSPVKDALFSEEQHVDDLGVHQVVALDAEETGAPHLHEEVATEEIDELPYQEVAVHQAVAVATEEIDEPQTQAVVHQQAVHQALAVATKETDVPQTQAVALAVATKETDVPQTQAVALAVATKETDVMPQQQVERTVRAVGQVGVHENKKEQMIEQQPFVKSWYLEGFADIPEETYEQIQEVEKIPEETYEHIQEVEKMQAEEYINHIVQRFATSYPHIYAIQDMSWIEENDGQNAAARYQLEIAAATVAGDRSLGGKLSMSTAMRVITNAITSVGYLLDELAKFEGETKPHRAEEDALTDILQGEKIVHCNTNANVQNMLMQHDTDQTIIVQDKIILHTLHGVNGDILRAAMHTVSRNANELFYNDETNDETENGDTKFIQIDNDKQALDVDIFGLNGLVQVVEYVMSNASSCIPTEHELKGMRQLVDNVNESTVLEKLIDQTSWGKSVVHADKLSVSQAGIDSIYMARRERIAEGDMLSWMDASVRTGLLHKRFEAVARIAVELLAFQQIVLAEQSEKIYTWSEDALAAIMSFITHKNSSITKGYIDRLTIDRPGLISVDNVMHFLIETYGTNYAIHAMKASVTYVEQLCVEQADEMFPGNKNNMLHILGSMLGHLDGLHEEWQEQWTKANIAKSAEASADALRASPQSTGAALWNAQHVMVKEYIHQADSDVPTGMVAKIMETRLGVQKYQMSEKEVDSRAIVNMCRMSQEMGAYLCTYVMMTHCMHQQHPSMVVMEPPKSDDDNLADISASDMRNTKDMCKFVTYVIADSVANEGEIGRDTAGMKKMIEKHVKDNNAACLIGTGTAKADTDYATAVKEQQAATIDGALQHDIEKLCLDEKIKRIILGPFDCEKHFCNFPLSAVDLRPQYGEANNTLISADQDGAYMPDAVVWGGIKDAFAAVDSSEHLYVKLLEGQSVNLYEPGPMSYSCIYQCCMNDIDMYVQEGILVQDYADTLQEMLQEKVLRIYQDQRGIYNVEDEKQITAMRKDAKMCSLENVDKCLREGLENKTYRDTMSRLCPFIIQACRTDYVQQCISFTDRLKLGNNINTEEMKQFVEHSNNKDDSIKIDNIADDEYLNIESIHLTASRPDSERAGFTEVLKHTASELYSLVRLKLYEGDGTTNWIDILKFYQNMVCYYGIYLDTDEVKELILLRIQALVQEKNLQLADAEVNTAVDMIRERVLGAMAFLASYGINEVQIVLEKRSDVEWDACLKERNEIDPANYKASMCDLLRLEDKKYKKLFTDLFCNMLTFTVEEVNKEYAAEDEDY